MALELHAKYSGLGAITQKTIKKLKHVVMESCTPCVRKLEKHGEITLMKKENQGNISV